jgi:hypothetical protein
LVSSAVLLAVALLAAACAWTPASLPSVYTVTPAPAEPAMVVTPAAGTAEALVIAVSTLAAGWLTFDDAGAGYSLSYPQDVHISTGRSKAGIYTTRIQFRIPGVDGYQGMLIRVEPNPAGVGVEQTIAALYERFTGEDAPADVLAALADATVDGLPGVQMGEGGDFAIVVPYADRVFIIAPVHDQATVALDPQALALFYEVLATLRVQR